MGRKFFVLIAVFLLAIAVRGPMSFAQGMGATAGKDMMKGDMMGKGKMTKMPPMSGMMMKGMAEKSMVATADGGVIVLVGNKLIKYDKDLNVVKEVEIKIDMEAMRKNMREMMKDCPMMKGAMMGADTDGNDVSPAGGMDQDASR